MLVLTRSKSEIIVIEHPDGTIVEVMAIDCRQNKVRLGFDAPREIRIYRKELADDANPKYAA